jgi:hypothetical protein
MTRKPSTIMASNPAVSRHFNPRVPWARSLRASLKNHFIAAADVRRIRTPKKERHVANELGLESLI